MTCHADRVREAERELVAECLRELVGASSMHNVRAQAALVRDLRAETCPTCDGTGTVEMHEDVRGRMICPANCDAGRRRDRT